MEVPIYNRYIENYSNRISKLFEEIDKFEEAIQNIDIYEDFAIDSKKLAIKELKNEIIKYIQYNNGSLGFDIVLIKCMLKELLGYSYILIGEKLSEEEINTCDLEIDVRIYFFLNCIYNFRGKLKELFRIEYCKKEKNYIMNDNNILKNPVIILDLLKVFFNKINKYCEARNKIVHHIYEIKLDKVENKINIFISKFNLSKDSIFNKNKNYPEEITLKDLELIEVVVEMQKIRKNIIEFLLDVENNINTEELKNKFKKEKGYSFLNDGILFKN